jgi:hypothetical protein
MEGGECLEDDELEDAALGEEEEAGAGLEGREAAGGPRVARHGLALEERHHAALAHLPLAVAHPTHGLNTVRVELVVLQSAPKLIKSYFKKKKKIK